MSEVLLLLWTLAGIRLPFATGSESPVPGKKDDGKSLCRRILPLGRLVYRKSGSCTEGTEKLRLHSLEQRLFLLRSPPGSVFNLAVLELDGRNKGKLGRMCKRVSRNEQGKALEF